MILRHYLPRVLVVTNIDFPHDNLHFLSSYPKHLFKKKCKVLMSMLARHIERGGVRLSMVEAQRSFSNSKATLFLEQQEQSSNSLSSHAAEDHLACLAANQCLDTDNMMKSNLGHCIQKTNCKFGSSSEFRASKIWL